jgi:hypothetical protein
MEEHMHMNSRMMTRRGSVAAGLIAAALAIALPASVAAQPSTYEQDRRSILSMAGDYKVRFDFRETTPFRADYTPLEPKLSGGHEVVRVIADTGRFISLQHLLVVTHEGKTHVIKHWRQDWTYEPTQVLTYASRNRWTLTPVSSSARRGAWSQTVWQTEDSPRYGGVGRWSYDTGAAVWTSGVTMRPLARRDAIRNPPYDRYSAINRHAITPVGWVHEQDNAKLGLVSGTLSTFVHEDGVNTYSKFNGYDVAAADSYWAKTKDYWAAVRAAWDAAIVRGRGVSIEEEAQNGAVTGPTLMGLADRINDGEISTEAAIIEARAKIEAETRRALPSTPAT